MIWFIYNDYVKKSIKTSTFIKFLRWYVWVILAVIMIIDIGLYITAFHYDMAWVQWILYFFAAVTGFYFGNEVRKIIRKKAGSFEDIYWSNMTILRNILNERRITTRSQVDLLIEQIELELPKLKISDAIFKPINSVTILIVVPLITLIINWLLDQHPEGIFIVGQIISIIIMVLSLYYMIKPLIEEVLDLEHKRMSRLKDMIQDLRIIDFCREK